MSEEAKYLLYPADGDIDEDDGQTLEQIMRSIAARLGYTIEERRSK